MYVQITSCVYWEAIDEKHVLIKAPARSGTLYNNLKGTFTFVLLTICAAKYNFILADVGQYGSNNDSDVLVQLNIVYAFENNKLNLSGKETRIRIRN